MSYQPYFTITPALLALVEEIATIRQRIHGAAVEVSWTAALQTDSRRRNAHASTAIEGNPLTLAQVGLVETGERLAGGDSRSEQEVRNYFAGLRYIERNAAIGRVRHEDVLTLHKLLTAGVLDQGDAGCYRTIAVRVGDHVPPAAGEVSGLMFELLEWWNENALELSPVLSSAILHHRFETIHPFADGNGRTGRSLALWDLYRRGFDSHHIFSVDEYYWEDRPRYYAALSAVRHAGDDLTLWLEYTAEGLRQTLERVWLRIQSLQLHPPAKLVLSPKQERLLQLLRDHGSLAPAEIWAALELSRQGAMNVLHPLLDAGVVERFGGKKTGRYKLSKP